MGLYKSSMDLLTHGKLSPERRLLVSGPVAPVFVETGWTHRAPTVFFPDGSLRAPDRLEEGEADELLMPISWDIDPEQWAALGASGRGVELHFSAGLYPRSFHPILAMWR